ncbi:MAG: crosslink repair DNA glycosylase YcaQ family protein [Actinomycetota bacterium]|nr:crosslink repair DNA glycosylase YcaQ family protein [Actinomycetota bacterium]
MNSLSILEARHIALGAQGLSENRPAEKIGRRHLRQCMKAMELVQLDAVPVVIRTQYLPFYSRLGPYNPKLFDEIAYKDDQWYELWAHEASIAPVEIEPYLRFNKKRAANGDTWKGLYRLAVEEPSYIKKVLREVELKGPIEAKDLSDPQPRKNTGWGHRSKGQLALNWLYRIGEVGIRRGPNFENKFDLLGRIVPSKILSIPTPSDHDSLKNLLLRSSKAYGVATAPDLVDYFRLPTKEARLAIADLVDNKQLEEVQIESWKEKAYIAPHISIPKSANGCSLVSPFDPIVWNRKRLDRLFDFQYKLEMYTPESKRRFGYYVLPLLIDDRFVGRFDIRNIRDKRTLHVKASFLEKGVEAGDIAQKAFDELANLAKFLEAQEVKIDRKGNFSVYLKKLAGH